MSSLKSIRALAANDVFEGVIELGPRDLKRVAQLKGLDYATAVRTFHRALKEFGLKVWAGANNEMLGLVMAFFVCSPEVDYRDVAFDAFSALPNLACLGVDMTDLTTIYGLMYVPADSAGHTYMTLFEELKKRRVLAEYWTYTVSKQLRYSLRPECVDWTTGKPSFDWDALRDREPEDTVFGLSETPQADYIDLLIIKELESDATLTFAQISERLSLKNGVSISDRLVLYHFTNHLMGRRLLSRYKVFFPLSNVVSTFLIAKVRPGHLDSFTRMVRRAPFLGIELFNEDGEIHISTHNVPLEHLEGFIKFVHGKLAPLVSSLDFKMSIQGMRLVYTIPFELFDRETGRWMYDPARDLERIQTKAEGLRAKTVLKGMNQK